ncbi:MAG: transcription elongation factor GreA [Alphaproteobacteria bacterium]|jgi:transcription elongation factor GreA|nr:transcription elongation factor GreA [Alphaproteobacteria bacterium]
MQKYPITLTGLKSLELERNKLKNEDRPSVIKAISSARDLGDLSENAEYHAAREQQAFIEGRIKDLDDLISRADVIDPTNIVSEKVMFGATVILEDLDEGDKRTYQIVGEFEANLEKGLISYTSPLGKSLIGKSKGDVIDNTTPKTTKSWEILEIVYK